MHDKTFYDRHGIVTVDGQQWWTAATNEFGQAALQRLSIRVNLPCEAGREIEHVLDCLLDGAALGFRSTVDGGRYVVYPVVDGCWVVCARDGVRVHVQADRWVPV